MLEEETKDPVLPAQVLRTKAMQTIVPKLASKVFARFDEVINRVMDDVSVLIISSWHHYHLAPVIDLLAGGFDRPIVPSKQ
jgi:predicted dehydrogenase